MQSLFHYLEILSSMCTTTFLTSLGSIKSLFAVDEEILQFERFNQICVPHHSTIKQLEIRKQRRKIVLLNRARNKLTFVANFRLRWPTDVRAFNGEQRVQGRGYSSHVVATSINPPTPLAWKSKMSMTDYARKKIKSKSLKDYKKPLSIYAL